MEEKNVALKPCLSHFVGDGDRALQTCLPPLVGGEGDHEVVEGGADWRHYKNCGEAATATL